MTVRKARRANPRAKAQGSFPAARKINRRVDLPLFVFIKWPHLFPLHWAGSIFNLRRAWKSFPARETVLWPTSTTNRRINSKRTDRDSTPRLSRAVRDCCTPTTPVLHVAPTLVFAITPLMLYAGTEGVEHRSSCMELLRSRLRLVPLYRFSVPTLRWGDFVLLVRTRKRWLRICQGGAARLIYFLLCDLIALILICKFWFRQFVYRHLRSSFSVVGCNTKELSNTDMNFQRGLAIQRDYMRTECCVRWRQNSATDTEF